MSTDLKALTSSASNEWFTPPRYIEMVKQVFDGGYIDLDPFSCEAANKIVGARQYWTIDQDAFNQDWIADNVFMNPPYGKVFNDSQAGLACTMLICEYYKNRFKEAIILVNSCTGAGWFEPLYNWTICFVDHRIHYDVPPLPDGADDATVLEWILGRKPANKHTELRKKLAVKTLTELEKFYYSQNQPSKDNVFVYLGPNWRRFIEVFGAIGRCRLRSALLPEYVNGLKTRHVYIPRLSLTDVPGPGCRECGRPSDADIHV